MSNVFSNDTLRALGLNEAGVRAAWFRVWVSRTTRGTSIAFTHARYNTAAEADAAVQTHLAAGLWPTVDVWWSGDTTPVRQWSPLPPTRAR